MAFRPAIFAIHAIAGPVKSLQSNKGEKSMKLRNQFLTHNKSGNQPLTLFYSIEGYRAECPTTREYVEVRDTNHNQKKVLSPDEKHHVMMDTLARNWNNLQRRHQINNRQQLLQDCEDEIKTFIDRKGRGSVQDTIIELYSIGFQDAVDLMAKVSVEAKPE